MESLRARHAHVSPRRALPYAAHTTDRQLQYLGLYHTRHRGAAPPAAATAYNACLLACSVLEGARTKEKKICCDIICGRCFGEE